MKRSTADRDLVRELRAVGVPDGEIAELTRAAQRLSKLSVPGMSRAAKQRVANRLPIDIDAYAEVPRRLPSVRWALAGSFAVLALVIGITWAALPGSTPNTDKPAKGTSQARQDPTPDQSEQMLEQHAAQIQELQQQPTVDEKALQKAKEDFRRSYNQYRLLNGKNIQDIKDAWKNYELQWQQTQANGSGSSTSK